MNIAFDLDGVLSKKGRPEWIPTLFLTIILFFFRWILLFSKENNEGIEFAKTLKKNGDTIIILSARPTFCLSITIKWLKRKKIPFDKVHCIGLKSSKIPFLKKENICIFIDDERENIQQAEKAGIDVFDIKYV